LEKFQGPFENYFLDFSTENEPFTIGFLQISYNKTILFLDSSKKNK